MNEFTFTDTRVLIRTSTDGGFWDSADDRECRFFLADGTASLYVSRDGTDFLEISLPLPVLRMLYFSAARQSPDEETG